MIETIKIPMYVSDHFQSVTTPSSIHSPESVLAFYNPLTWIHTGKHITSYQSVTSWGSRVMVVEAAPPARVWRRLFQFQILMLNLSSQSLILFSLSIH